MNTSQKSLRTYSRRPVVERMAFAIMIPLFACGSILADDDLARKQAYVEAVTRGAGMLDWQTSYPTEAESEFRAEIEALKDQILGSRTEIQHPVLLSPEDLKCAKKNLESAEWAQKLFQGYQSTADYVVSQPAGFVESMLSKLTPGFGYGFTCPNCVGEESQESAGSSLVEWTIERPEEICCKRCGQVYPCEKYPETMQLVCPRMGQTFSYYLNDKERANPDDRTGQLAWHWVGHPMHVSFTGLVRERKNNYMMGALRSLALAYALTGEPRYAEKTAQILERMAVCYRNWLYHDYWDTIADCDPMYAAWHDKDLRLEWKRHLCADVFEKDTVKKAGMMQNYWGAGRWHPSTDAVSNLVTVCLAYDLAYDAKGSDGKPIWTPERRAKVERDLILEWELGAEPYVGGHGEANNNNNKSPRIYNAQAAVAKCLGLPELADTAYRGYQVVRDNSFNYDGFSTESPAYTNMYLGQLLHVPETLCGFEWPDDFEGRQGILDPYKDDPLLKLMYQSVIDQLRPDGRYLPLEDTNEVSSPSRDILEIGVKRYPEMYKRALTGSYQPYSPGEYAFFHFGPEQVNQKGNLELPEIFYPAWMTAILRHGQGPESSVLSLNLSPAGGHRHYDNLAIYYLDQGQTILGDHGYVGDMPVNRWIKSTYSHNLVIVDNDQQIHGGNNPRQPKLELMFTSPLVSVVEASSDAYKQCSEYRRLIVLLKGPGGQTLAVDIFRVSGGNIHDYRVFSELAASDSAQAQIAFTGLSMEAEPPLPDVKSSLKTEDIYGLRDTRSVSNPASVWQAIWQQEGRKYRLWMLSEVDRVEASNGPGQTTLRNPGRRVRYVDAINEGQDISSVFIAVHEPSALDGDFAVNSIARLEVPEAAGPDAVALQIETEWGNYRLFNEFEGKAKIGNMSFQGKFGLYGEVIEQGACLASAGASTFMINQQGFEKKSPLWQGNVLESGPFEMQTDVPKPDDWELPRQGAQAFVLAEIDGFQTGFPLSEVASQTLKVERFPMPGASRFVAPAVRLQKLKSD